MMMMMMMMMTYLGEESCERHCRIHEQSTAGIQRQMRHAAIERRTKRRHDDQDDGCYW